MPEPTGVMPEVWLEMIDENGLDAMLSLLTRLDDHDKVSAEAAIEIYKQKQVDSRNLRQEERENKTLEIAREANEISKGANTIARLAIVASMIAIVVSVLVAFGQKGS